MPNYPLELYERLLAGGEPALLAEVQRADPEHVYLDFKRVASSPSLYTRANGFSLHPSDLTNLGKALSGFANSRGGVIVWGIDCVGNDPMSRGIAPGVESVGSFKGVVRSLLGKASTPALADIRLDVIELPSVPGKGALLMYVPQREYGPVRAGVGEGTDRYYFRAGDSFLAVPHDVLAAMFGRTPPPNVFWKVVIASNRPAFVGREVKIEAAIVLHNKGQALGFHPYFTVTMDTPGENCELRYSELDSERFTFHGVLDAFVTVVGRPDYPLPTGALAGAVLITLTLCPPFTRGIRLDAGSGCDGALPHELTRKVDVEAVRRAYDLAVNEGASQSQVWGSMFPDPA
ncbi:MAG: ATP-binding protein [Pseudomonadota bacterium]|nr:ATP-binding protein [Pseudomonadota bacterium]